MAVKKTTAKNKKKDTKPAKRWAVGAGSWMTAFKSKASATTYLKNCNGATMYECTPIAKVEKTVKVIEV